MVINALLSRRRVSACVCFVLFTGVFANQAFPQTSSASVTAADGDGGAADKNFSFHTSESGGVFFTQKLSWQEIPYTRKYILDFERKDETGTFVPYGDPMETEENSIERSFPPGVYRYSVKVVNLLGKTQALSEFREFEVLQAFEPEIYSVSPEYIFLDYPQTGIFHVQGVRLFKDTSFSLESDEKTVFPTDVDVDNEREVSSVTVTFPVEALSAGDYALVAVDPSGLSDSFPVAVRHQKPVGFLLSVSYKPLFILYDDDFKDSFGVNSLAWGAELCATVVSRKSASLHTGLSIRLGYNGSSSGNVSSGVSPNMFLGFLNFDVFFLSQDSRVFIDVWFGPGVCGIQGERFVEGDDPDDPDVEDFSSWSVGANAGFSIMYFFTEKRRVFAQCGLEGIFALYDGNTALFAMAPKIGFGCQF